MARAPRQGDQGKPPRKNKKMTTASLKKLASQRRFISGIHNYCDRWCERCPFTSRCMNFAIGEEFFPEQQEQQDMRSAAFWDEIKEVFQQTAELMREMAAERGIDLSNLPPETEEEVARQRQHDEDVHAHALTRAGMAYIKMVDAWFKAAKALFQGKRRELVSKARMALEGHDPAAEALSITDATEVIRWYQHQITVKIMRALSHDPEDEIEAELAAQGFPSDRDGSAKVALLGMDRSLAAWGVLREHFPEEGDRILDILVHLDRLRRAVEKALPKARAFVRPGFDTGGKDPEEEE